MIHPCKLFKHNHVILYFTPTIVYKRILVDMWKVYKMTHAFSLSGFTHIKCKPSFQIHTIPYEFQVTTTNVGTLMVRYPARGVTLTPSSSLTKPAEYHNAVSSLITLYQPKVQV